MKNLYATLVPAIALLAPSAALAATQDRIDIPAGPLGEAVVALSRGTGASIRLTDPALWQLPVRPLRGTMSVKQALDRLLAGSGAVPIADRKSVV